MQRFVGRHRKFDFHRVVRSDDSADRHYPHDSGLAYHGSVLVAVENRCHKAILEVVELTARLAQAGHLDHRLTTKVQPCARRQKEKIDAAGENVLAHLARSYGETPQEKLVVQFAGEQMDLPQIGALGASPYLSPMADCRARMDIVLDPHPGYQQNGLSRRFGHGVRWAGANGLDSRTRHG